MSDKILIEDKECPVCDGEGEVQGEV